MEANPNSGFPPATVYSDPSTPILQMPGDLDGGDAGGDALVGNDVSDAVVAPDDMDYTSYLLLQPAAADDSLDLNLDLDIDPGYLGGGDSGGGTSSETASLSSVPPQQSFSALPRPLPPPSSAVTVPEVQAVRATSGPALPLAQTATRSRLRPIAPAGTAPLVSQTSGTVSWGAGGWELPPSSASSSSLQLAATQAAAKPRLERRGHKKSRRGCFNCKRRRIKCQETRPACGHCVKQGLRCEYPTMPTIVHQPQNQVPLFSLQDMRLLQNFLLNCYPHHPIGSEEMWLHEIPCLAERHEFLMHAILGYSASELMVTDPSLAEAALSHRLKAIRAIKKALGAPTSSPAGPVPSSSSSSTADSSSSSENNTSNKKKKSKLPPSPPSPPADPSSPPVIPPLPTGTTDPLYEEGNALIATCFALTYQSVLLADGMAEFMTFVRGVILVAIQMYMRNAKILFGPLLINDRQREVLRPFMEALPLVNAEWAARAQSGVEGLVALVEGEGREVERMYWGLLRNMANMLSVSSWQAYSSLTDLYGWWIMLSHDEFRRLVDPDNQVVLVLGAHWNALEQVMAVICETERKGATRLPERRATRTKTGSSSGGAGATTNTGWLKHIIGLIDDEHRPYMEFPMWVQEQLDKDRGFFGKTFY
ncbi:hypothetical protein VTJ49DRAFT_4430 [Mycothermus thermophilus]|uniref:Zn(2)-C6 fungal-type domain-containing protein n=1 Tax=Humicola insolens TaxID=85995 RepID=A0ABR3V690_HUMIN